MSLNWKPGQKAWRFNLSHQTQHPNPMALLWAFLLTHRNYFTYHFKRLLLASIAIHTSTGKEPTAINCCDSASDSFKTPFKEQWVEFWRNDSDKKKDRKLQGTKPYQCPLWWTVWCVQTLTRMQFCFLKVLLNKSEEKTIMACELCEWSNLRFQ